MILCHTLYTLYTQHKLHALYALYTLYRLYTLYTLYTRHAMYMGGRPARPATAQRPPDSLGPGVSSLARTSSLSGSCLKSPLRVKVPSSKQMARRHIGVLYIGPYI